MTMSYQPHAFITGAAVAILVSRIKDVRPDFEWSAASGPIDAPNTLPAGAMNSTSTRSGPWHLNDGRGREIPWATTFERA